MRKSIEIVLINFVIFFVTSAPLLSLGIHPPFAERPVLQFGRCEGALQGAPQGQDSSVIIEAALEAAGPGGIVVLNPGRYELHRPVRIRHSNQVLTTCQANIADSKGSLRRAFLVVVNRDGSSTNTVWGEALDRNATAFDAWGNGTVFSNLEINGGGPWDDGNALPPESQYHSALVLAGSNFSMHGCILEEPLGWTALQLSGDGQSVVVNNIIRNCGRPGRSVLGYGRWADGISSFAVATIKGNEVVNPTDVGIVVFSPEADVEDNHILVSGTNSYLMGGIALGDCWSSGIYDGVVVKNNLIETTMGGRIGLGLNVGPTNWRCNFCSDPSEVEIEDFNCQGSVLEGNALFGNGFEYGFVVSRVAGLVTSGNSFEGAFFSGEPLGCSGHVPPENRGALIASEDQERNTLTEGACESGCFWDSSFSRDDFYRLHN